jgi:hypothetical protein
MADILLFLALRADSLLFYEAPLAPSAPAPAATTTTKEFTDIIETSFEAIAQSFKMHTQLQRF